MRWLDAITVAIVVLGACDDTDDGKRCTLDSDCAAPFICSAPVPARGDPPLPGTCRQPAGVGGFCYRNADCEGNLVCGLSLPVAPLEAGDCEPANADASVSIDASPDASTDGALDLDPL